MSGKRKMMKRLKIQWKIEVERKKNQKKGNKSRTEAFYMHFELLIHC
jgi:hypothetical protein